MFNAENWYEVIEHKNYLFVIREKLDEGGLIYFKKRSSDKKWEKRMEEKGMVGHPPYAEWFCKEHYEKANELKDLAIDEAMKQLKT